MRSSTTELTRMTMEELKNVDNFTVFNKHGEIKFLGKTDVRGLDLDLRIKIEHRGVEVYPDEAFPVGVKPEVGEELNKPAVITLYNC